MGSLDGYGREELACFGSRFVDYSVLLVSFARLPHGAYLDSSEFDPRTLQ